MSALSPLTFVEGPAFPWSGLPEVLFLRLLRQCCAALESAELSKCWYWRGANNAIQLCLRKWKKLPCKNPHWKADSKLGVLGYVGIHEDVFFFFFFTTDYMRVYTASFYVSLVNTRPPCPVFTFLTGNWHRARAFNSLIPCLALFPSSCLHFLIPFSLEKAPLYSLISSFLSGCCILGFSHKGTMREAKCFAACVSDL